MFSTERRQQMKSWSESCLGHSDLQFSLASADASFRSYLRVEHGQQSWILMDSPPEREKNDEFVHISKLLLAQGINVPEVLHWDQHHGFMLLSDLGTTTYLDKLNEHSMPGLYGDALGALRQIQTSVNASSLPVYSATMLKDEMNLFSEWLIDTHLNHPMDTEIQQIWENSTDILIQSALAQPSVFVHRDFHSRNLMVQTYLNPGILDFQDAVKGPITYDLVSLLKDCYISWPRKQVLKLINAYYDGLIYVGLDLPEPGQFVRWFDYMGVQRHLKAAGIFARLLHRDGKGGYLKDIPRTLQYIVETGQLYSELKPFADWLELQIIPAVQQKYLPV
ncbi:MAG: aminoglycoside phosphotransferase family protein [bacterium]